MGVPNLSDGTPLTYEWLNQVADTINKLEVQNSDDSNVKFTGLHNGQDIQVLTGSKKVEVTQTKVEYQVPNITFATPFAAPPVVIAIVQTGKKSDEAYPAAVAISNVTSTDFDAVVQTFTTKTKLGVKGRAFNIRYVAIGKKQTTATT